MSDSELQGGKKELSASKMINREDVEDVNLDFDKWNMRRSLSLVRPTAFLLDQLLRVPRLYIDSRLWCLGTFLLSNISNKPPKMNPKTGLPEGPNCHIGQEGGLAGMKQKL